MTDAVAIGIDLGTTYSCVAVYRNQNVEIIANELGERTTPSYVAFKGNERLVGKGAKNQAAQNHTNTIFDAKRLIGRQFSDPEVQSDKAHWPFTLIADEAGKPQIQVDYMGKRETFSPEQISAFVLMAMKKTAENFLGQEVKDAVVTVPAYFNDAQRAATKVAGQIAGLTVHRIINEPTAAAIAYGLKEDDEATILIFDLGGGTFDVSLLTIDNGLFEVKGTAGDTHLGGEDFDSRLVEFFVKQFKRKHRIDISSNDRALRRLRTAAERAKRTLSSKTSATVEIESLAEGVDFKTSITRARFENLCKDYFQGCLRPVMQVLQDTNTPREAVDEVIMVGGSTRIPKVRELISQFFGNKELNHSINPDEAVAHGAAVQAAILMGIEDEKLGDLLLMDVAPLSLGIAGHDGMMKVIIPRNSPIPTNKKEKFSTSLDNQTAVMVQVYEGERPQVQYNHLLGKFVLGDIPPAPSGVPQIIVTFDLDADGLLNVTASEKSSGTSKKITITNDQGRLNQDEIKKMIADAARFKAEDDKVAKVAAVKAKLSQFIGHIGRVLKDPKYKEALSDEDRKSLTTNGGNAIKWFKSSGQSADADAYVKQLKDLAAVAVPILKATEKKYRDGLTKSAGSGGDDDMD